ncbi:GHKL domain-containing protein [Spongiibacter sp. KMU-158]|uniref:histidine kinase n=1 Tax=Spongiibacter pelagi TaxID=2760804 RepID=A0A927BYF5_9GAMM|nr:ATP-binding protein [Spongiibacter pelagi]MBD2857864.1 GHKL domain-containing protein [Spongiibacter pelagi]
MQAIIDDLDAQPPVADANESSPSSGWLPLIQRSLAIIAVIASLSVMAFLLWTTLRNTVETGLHIVRLEQLDRVTEADANLQRRLDQSRLDLEDGVSDLDAARDSFATAQRALSQGRAGLSGIDPQIDSALKEFNLSANQRLLALDGYRDSLDQLSLLFGSVRSQGLDLLGIPFVAQSKNFSRDIVSMLDVASSYSIRQQDSYAAEELDRLFVKLSIALAKINDDDLRVTLARFLDTVEALRFSRESLQKSRTELVQLDQLAKLTAVDRAYQDHFHQLQEVASRHRQTLAVFAVALLIAFGLIAFRLRSSFSTLDVLNDELKNANVHLEEIVERRTQDLQQALKDIRTQQAQLIQSEKMASLGQMVAGVAHEINTPLGYANSNVEIVRDSLQGLEEQLDADTRGEFDMLLADAQYGLEQISELVLSLKDFSRVDRSQTELFDVNDGLDTSLKICHNQLKDRVSIEREYAELPKISCAPSQLNQVFLNLINNASQAIDGAGTITIKTELENERVLIRVRDTGCGMDEETRAHIFEPFFTTKPIGEGTGLGLSIVFRIIEDHGGEISVASKKGEGTEFLISLPVASQSATNKKASAVLIDDSVEV